MSERPQRRANTKSSDAVMCKAAALTFTIKFSLACSSRFGKLLGVPYALARLLAVLYRVDLASWCVPRAVAVSCRDNSHTQRSSERSRCTHSHAKVDGLLGGRRGMPKSCVDRRLLHALPPLSQKAKQSQLRPCHPSRLVDVPICAIRAATEYPRSHAPREA